MGLADQFETLHSPNRHAKACMWRLRSPSVGIPSVPCLITGCPETRLEIPSAPLAWVCRQGHTQERGAAVTTRSVYTRNCARAPGWWLGPTNKARSLGSNSPARYCAYTTTRLRGYANDSERTVYNQRATSHHQLPARSSPPSKEGALSNAKDSQADSNPVTWTMQVHASGLGRRLLPHAAGCRLGQDEGQGPGGVVGAFRPAAPAAGERG